MVSAKQIKGKEQLRKTYGNEEKSKCRQKQMSTKDKFFVGIRKYLALGDNEEVGKQALVGILSGFSSPKNPNMERFLKKVRLSLQRRTSP